jgi:cytidylate kinase
MRDVVTVDGLAGSGKSALARALASELGFCHLNSGLVYRLVAFLTLEQGWDPTCEADVLRALEGRQIVFGRDSQGQSQIEVDGEIRGRELHEPRISEASSLVARHQSVRNAVLALQRNAYLPHGIVAEGRDMGTVVFPAAKVKFFIVGALEVRAQRRFDQLNNSSPGIAIEEVLEGLKQRDERDSSSQVGTMKQAEGCIVIDNSTKPFEEVVKEMLALVAKHH